MAAKKTKPRANTKRARMLVPVDELDRRLELVDRVLWLRDEAQKAADKARRKKRRVKPDSDAKISLNAIRDAYRRDPELKAIPFRSLYTLALARERVGGRLESLVRRLGQGRALEIALITDEDTGLREKLLKKGRYLKLQSGRRKRIEQVTIAELRAYIAQHRTGAELRSVEKKPRSPGGKRGPRVRWPEHLRRVLGQLMDDTMWDRLKVAFELSRFPKRVPQAMAAGVNPGTRALQQMDEEQLRSFRDRVIELGRMLGITLERVRRRER